MKSGFLLNIIICKGSAIFKLFSCKNKSLLISWDSFFVIDFGFNFFNCINWVNFKSDGSTSQGFYEDLNFAATSQSKDQVKSAFFLDVVVCNSSITLKFFTSENKSLLIIWDTFFVCDFSFDIFNCINTWVNCKSNCFTDKGFYENLDFFHFVVVCLFIDCVFLFFYYDYPVKFAFIY